MVAGAAATAAVAAVDAAEADATGNRFRHSKLLGGTARLGIFSTGLSRRVLFAENLALLISQFNLQPEFFSSVALSLSVGTPLDRRGAPPRIRICKYPRCDVGVTSTVIYSRLLSSILACVVSNPNRDFETESSLLSP